MPKTQLMLKNHQSPGDILMLTALVRDLKIAHPDYDIAVKTSADVLFDNNPNIVQIKPKPRVFNTNAKNLSDRKDTTYNGWIQIKCHYSDEEQFGKDVKNPFSVHKCGEHQQHFMYGMIGYLNALFEGMQFDIKLTELKPDIYLTEKERNPTWLVSTTTHSSEKHMEYAKSLREYFQVRHVLKRNDIDKYEQMLPRDDYWVIVPGGKKDYPRKIWAKRNWEELFRFKPDTKFVQIGGAEKDHIKPEFQGFDNVFDLSGRTSLRDVLALVYNAKGVICPITYAMHVAACWPEKKCIVIAGGGEHWTWEAYPGHDFLHTCGVLECCKEGGCWKGECANKHSDGEQKCMKFITSEMVADIVTGYEYSAGEKREGKKTNEV